MGSPRVSKLPRLKATVLKAMVLAILLPGLAAQPVPAGGPLEGGALVEALRKGGYTIYFRHAETDWSNDDNVGGMGDWTSCDPGRMRQLSAKGRETARRIGAAIRKLGIPVGRVRSSEYCRHAETARRVGVGVVNQSLCECFLNFVEIASEMAMLLAFVLFGAVLSGILGSVALGPALILAALVIFLIRPPVLGLVLSRAKLSWEARAFVAWFGPRGLNSLLLYDLVIKIL